MSRADIRLCALPNASIASGIVSKSETPFVIAIVPYYFHESDCAILISSM